MGEAGPLTSTPLKAAAQTNTGSAPRMYGKRPIDQLPPVPPKMVSQKFDPFGAKRAFEFIVSTRLKPNVSLK
jgi:hypothetical protein